jgi:hypothetical protein
MNCTLFRGFIAAFLSAMSLASLGSRSEAGIILLNPSFESPNIADGTAAGPGGQTNWNSNSFTLDNNTTQTQWFNEPVPDGQQALALSGFIAQKLVDSVGGDVPISQSLQIDVSFNAGRRKDSFGDGPGVFRVILQQYSDAGAFTLINFADQKFQTATDADPTTIDLNIPVGQWLDTLVTTRLTIPVGLNGGTAAGNDIWVAFERLSGDEVALDVVSAAVVPEPSSLATLLLASLALCLYRCTTKKK